MKEEIKDIEGFEDYSISNFGYVISKERYTDNGKTVFALKKEKILTVSGNKGYGGYVTLYKDKKGYNFKLKDLIAKYFIESPSKYSLDFYDVEFKDKDNTNCKADNLYYEINNLALRLFDLEGNWLGDYPNASKLEELYNIPSSHLYQVASGGSNFTNCFQTRFLKTYGKNLNRIKSLPSVLDKRRSDTAPIAKYWDNKLICVYNSVTEAAESNDLKVEEVWSSRDRNITIKGFVFKKI